MSLLFRKCTVGLKDRERIESAQNFFFAWNFSYEICVILVAQFI